MPLIIRCSNCNKPIGTVDPPCHCDEDQHITQGYEDGWLVVHGSLIATKVSIRYSCSDECTNALYGREGRT